MSFRRAPHLQRRNGIFHFRMRVPDDLRETIGAREIKRSLGTYSSSTARLIALRCSASILKSFEMMRHQSASKETARKIIASVFAELAAVADDGYSAASGDPNEITMQRAGAEDELRGLTRQLSTQQFDVGIELWARRNLHERGVDFDGLGRPQQLDLISGMVRARAEQQRLFLFRLEDRLSPYCPADPILQDAPSPIALPAISVRGKATASLGELVDTYLEVKQTEWAKKTFDTIKPKVSLLVEALGSERSITAIRASDIRDYRDALLKMRNEAASRSSIPFAKRLTENTSKQVSPRTAQLHFEAAKAFFNWAAQEAYIEQSPVGTILIKVPKAIERPRRPFTRDELHTLFRAPVFTGRRSRRDRLAAGTVVVHDAYFWIPILAYYTGMRAGELVQLHLADIKLDETHPYINVSLEGSGKSGTSTYKQVKSVSGVRKVPLHPDLVALGFPEFVRSRRKAHASKIRLFFEVPFGRNGEPSAVFSKWFRKLTNSVGLTDKATVFHSFRHGVQDAFKNAGTQQFITDKIFGHADGSTSGGYGNGVSLEVMFNAMKNAKFEVSVSELIKPKTGA